MIPRAAQRGRGPRCADGQPPGLLPGHGSWRWHVAGPYWYRPRPVQGPRGCTAGGPIGSSAGGGVWGRGPGIGPLGGLWPPHGPPCGPLPGALGPIDRGRLPGYKWDAGGAGRPGPPPYRSSAAAAARLLPARRATAPAGPPRPYGGGGRGGRPSAGPDGPSPAPPPGYPPGPAGWATPGWAAWRRPALRSARPLGPVGAAPPRPPTGAAPGPGAPPSGGGLRPPWAAVPPGGAPGLCPHLRTGQDIAGERRGAGPRQTLPCEHGILCRGRSRPPPRPAIARGVSRPPSYGGHPLTRPSVICLIDSPPDRVRGGGRVQSIAGPKLLTTVAQMTRGWVGFGRT